MSDVATYLPGTLESIREWFRTYKTYDGKPQNEFGFNGEFLGAKYAKGVIDHAHESWKKLLSGAYVETIAAGGTQGVAVILPNQGMTSRLVYPPTAPL